MTFAGTAPNEAESFYVDPITGSLNGDGSAANPWKTLAEVISANKIETYDKSGNIKNAGAPIKSGDTIWLRSGYHGEITINGAFNASTITVAAEPGHTPKIRAVELNGVSKWKFKGLSISPSHAPAAALRNKAIVRIGINGNFWGNIREVEFDNNDIFTASDSSSWTAADWNALAYVGLSEGGEYNLIHNNRIKNVSYGLSSGSSHSLIERNTIENFHGDGMRGLGNYSTFQYNIVKNVYDVNDDHNDGFQSWSRGADGQVGTGTVYGNILRGNKFFGWTDPNQPFKGPLQGIGCFDGMFDGWVVENNLVAVDHWHGITFLGMKNSSVINNTAVDLTSPTPGPTWIRVANHKNGTPSENVIVRNNIAAGGISGEARATVIKDHNLQPKFTDYPIYFNDPAAFDFRLKPGSPAINTGSSEKAPVVDIQLLSRPQENVIDIGAYEFSSTSTTPPTPSTNPPVPPTPPPPSNTTPAPQPPTASPAKPGDLNNSGKIDILDLSILLSKYGTNSSIGDLNSSGKVDILDLSILLSRYGI